MEDPTYHLSLGIFRDFSHIQTIGAPVDNDGLVIDEKFEKLIINTKPSLIYTIPTFHNPTGIILFFIYFYNFII